MPRSDQRNQLRMAASGFARRWGKRKAVVFASLGTSAERLTGGKGLSTGVLAALGQRLRRTDH